MNEHEKYLFDLNGYLVVEDVLTPDEVAFCNEAIDHHADQIRERVGELSLLQRLSPTERCSGRLTTNGDLCCSAIHRGTWRMPKATFQVGRVQCWRD